MADEEKKVKQLLSELQKSGAEIKDAKTQSKLTADALSEKAAFNDFGAWVSWTKRF